MNTNAILAPVFTGLSCATFVEINGQVNWHTVSQKWPPIEISGKNKDFKVVVNLKKSLKVLLPFSFHLFHDFSILVLKVEITLLLLLVVDLVM
jgi:hypothetical protein